ncbi:MAG: adenylyl-sulfate kinase [Bacillota bacterium]
MKEHNGVTVWLTGLSGSGKTTIARELKNKLRERKSEVAILDGDKIRRTIARGLGFSREDREENIRRIGYMAWRLTLRGLIVLVSAISPFREVRDQVRNTIGDFIEVYVNAPLEVCEKRDVKGLYKMARKGAIREFTGIDSPYEHPLYPDVECLTDRESIDESVEKVLVIWRGVFTGGSMPVNSRWPGAKSRIAWESPGFIPVSR